MPGPIDVTRLLDTRPMSPTQKTAVGICAAIAAIEGFDAQIMGYVAPAITKEWSLPAAALTVVLTAGIVGMILGALLVGPLADRVGRKNVLIAGTIMFGLFTALAAVTPTVTVLTVLRVLAGVGVGAATPTVVALVSEFVPARRRATVMMAVISGMSVGAFLGGLGAAWVIPSLGWRAVMLIGGAIPLVILLLGGRTLPESLAFLAAAGRDDQARRLLGRIAPEVGHDSELVWSGPSAVRARRVPVRELFVRGLRARTLLLWVSFVAALMVTYFVGSWTPTLFVTAGMSMQLASVALSTTMLGSVFGGVIMGILVDRSRVRFGVLALGLVLAAAAIGVLVLSVGHPVLMLASLFVVGFGALGCQIGLFAFAADVYPTTIRSTGVSWASGVGRFGSLLGPVLGGVLVGAAFAPFTIFAMLIVPILLGAGTIALAARHSSTGGSPRDPAWRSTGPDRSVPGSISPRDALESSAARLED